MKRYRHSPKVILLDAAVLLAILITWIVLATPATALSISEKTTEPRISVIQDAPFYISGASVKDGVLTFTVAINEKNATVKDTSAVKLKVVDIASKELSVSSLKVGDSEQLAKSADLKGDSYTVWIPKDDVKDGYSKKVELKYTGGEKFMVKFGINSSSVTIISGATFDVVGEWMTWKTKDLMSSAVDNYADEWVDQSSVDWGWGTIAGVFDGGATVTPECYANGTGDSFSTPVMSRVYCERDTKLANRTFTFYTGSNATDIYTKVGNNGAKFKIWAPFYGNLKPLNVYWCNGMAANLTLAAGNTYVDAGTEPWCANWDPDGNYKQTVMNLAKYNASTNTSFFALQNNGAALGTVVGRGYNGADMIPDNSADFQRVTFTEPDNGGSPYASMWKEKNRFYDAGSITNTTGGCVNFYEGKFGGVIGSADVFKCQADISLSVSLTPNANVSRIWLDISGFQGTNIWVMNASVGTPDSGDLYAHLKNYSGSWYYFQKDGTETPLGCGSNNTEINSGVCNITGVWDYGPNSTDEKRLFLVFDVSGSMDIYVTNFTPGAGASATSKFYARDQTSGAYLTFNLTVANSTNSYSWTNQNPLSIASDNINLPSGWITATVTSNVAPGYGQGQKYFYLNRSGDNNQTVWLLESASGAYYHIKTMTIADMAIPGSSIYVYTTVGGTMTLVGSGLTDISGSTLFFMNPLTTYLVDAQKAGWTNPTPNASLMPAEPIVIHLSSGSGANISGMNLQFVPPSGALENTSTVFNFSIISGNCSLHNFWMNLTLNGTQVFHNEGITQGPCGGSLNYTALLQNFSGTYMNATICYNTTAGTVCFSYMYYIWALTDGLWSHIQTSFLGVCTAGTTITKMGIVWCPPVNVIALIFSFLAAAVTAVKFSFNGGGIVATFVLWCFVLIGWFPAAAAAVLTLGMIGIVILRGGTGG